MSARAKIIHWSRERRTVLKIADRLGRGRGHLRVLDLFPPCPPACERPSLAGWERCPLGAIWIGHSTILLRIGGLTILTDPVFSNRVGLGLGVITAGPRRLKAPALRMSELPKIDLVLLSHAHFDHLDRPSLRKLPRGTPFITASRTSDLITDLGFRAVNELAWHETRREHSLSITAVPCRHWGARTLHDDYRGYNGYLIRSDDHSIFFGGDTAYHTQLPKGPVDLAVVGIGAYEPWTHSHATPEEAIAMTQQVGAKRLLPMHHSTFPLGAEPMHEPIERVTRAAAHAGIEIVVAKVGGQWRTAPAAIRADEEPPVLTTSRDQ